MKAACFLSSWCAILSFLSSAMDTEPLVSDHEHRATEAELSHSGVIVNATHDAERLSGTQKLLQIGILLFELMRYAATEAYALWIPITMQLSESFFIVKTPQGTLRVDEEAHNGYVRR